MPSQFSARLCAAAVSVFVCAAADADTFTWSYSAGKPQPGIATADNDGGAIHSILASFDDLTKQLTWSVNFSDRVTEGFWLALSGGDNPTGRVGEYGAFFFDAYDAFDNDASTNVRLTAYGYNGATGHNSWLDGDAASPGVQPADCIKSALDTPWIIDISATDALLPGGIAGRSMRFTIDASDILSHAPLYPAPESWKGTGFGDLLGFRMGAAAVYETDYSDTGEIAELGTESQSFFVGQLQQTQIIPAPAAGALALAGLAVGIQSRRRRRSS